jgi:dolichol-phosphate mannosyltransferase
MTTLSVIVPTYNEAENVQELLERIKSSLGDQSFDVVVVDDNSPDGTADVIERLSAKWGNIKLLRRRGKMGLGSAVVDGMKAADGKGGVERWSIIRRTISRGAILLAHFLFPKTRTVRDAISGFLFKRGVIYADRLNSSGYKILLEILIKGRYNKVAEVSLYFQD